MRETLPPKGITFSSPDGSSLLVAIAEAHVSWVREYTGGGHSGSMWQGGEGFFGGTRSLVFGRREMG